MLGHILECPRRAPIFIKVLSLGVGIALRQTTRHALLFRGASKNGACGVYLRYGFGDPKQPQRLYSNKLLRPIGSAASFFETSVLVARMGGSQEPAGFPWGCPVRQPVRATAFLAKCGGLQCNPGVNMSTSTKSAAKAAWSVVDQIDHFDLNLRAFRAVESLAINEKPESEESLSQLRRSDLAALLCVLGVSAQDRVEKIRTDAALLAAALNKTGA
jgi:hypothetical protein